jgi:phosphatidylinositol glycan class K
MDSLSHSNNWAVIVSTSRFWFNYRHPANSFSVYHAVKRLGIPDHQIILMMADDVACNPRNIEPGCVFNHYDRKISVYDKHVEVDYRDQDVTAETFLRVLTDRHASDVPRSKRLLTNSESNILLYLTGHGGDGFLKFQDAGELTSYDLADAIQQMWDKQRYKNMLFIIDTCQAQSLPDRIRSPRVVSMSSSRIGESSYSHHNDDILGVPVIDRFTNHLLVFLENMSVHSEKTIGDFEDSWSSVSFHSTATLHWTQPWTKSIVRKFKLADFFAQVLEPVTHPCSKQSKDIQDLYQLISSTKERASKGMQHLETPIVSDYIEMIHVYYIDIPNQRIKMESDDYHMPLVFICILILSIYYLFSTWVKSKTLPACNR